MDAPCLLVRNRNPPGGKCKCGFLIIQCAIVAGADAEPERPLTEAVPAPPPGKKDPEDVFENYSRGNVKLGEAPKDPRDTRTEQSR
jgi:hypothetical protein